MSIKYGLLALLEREPMYGYQLRAEFERSTGATWPLNIGQVYTTLSRLHRDGLVDETGESDEQGKVVYRLTDHGPRRPRPLVHHAGHPGRPAPRRAGHQGRARGHHAGRRRARPSCRPSAPRPSATSRSSPGSRPARARRTLAWLLVLDSMIFRAEAEVRWLDHSETRLARMAPPARPAPAPESAPEPATHTQEVTR